MEISYCFMTEEDISQVAALEKKAFSQPWSADGIKHYLDAGHTLFVVAKNGEKVAAYAAVMCVLEEGNLVSIVVDENYRRMGIATELLDILYNELNEEGIEKIYLEVRQNNLPAIAFYNKEGFEQIGMRKGFYDKPKEDALLFEKPLHR